MKNKVLKFTALALGLASITACSTFSEWSNKVHTVNNKIKTLSQKSFQKRSASSPAIDLNFNQEQYEIQEINVNGQRIKVRAFENISYVSYPVDAEYQRLNFYVPEAYFEGKSIDGFDIRTAPIFLPNNIGGYMPSLAGTAQPQTMRRGADKTNSIALALSKGFVVASPATRGRTQATGKAPAQIIDLKAAVRYLHANDMVMAGDATKIISNGTSAGGALSALLGASGNNEDFLPELEKIGAADARDDIFAVSAYCPITDLEHADSAYEWQFAGHHHYKKIDISMLDYKVQRTETSGVLNDEEIELSNKLKTAFPVYVNQLALKNEQGKILTLDIHGEGNFKDLVKSYVIKSAQTALDQGQDLSRFTWLKIENKQVVDLDFNAYVAYAGRMKLPPAFDAIDLSSGENQLFGTEKVDKRHFTDFSVKHHQGKEKNRKADERSIKLMNPMNYIGKKYTHTAPNWRIRHGSIDRDTSLAVPVILATQLQNRGYATDFALVWEQGHGGDYDLEQLFEWAKKISASPK